MIIEYYILAVNSEGVLQTFPSNAPQNTILFILGELPDLYSTDFESNGNDWIVGDPDECTRQIKTLEEETGGFGGFLMIPVEWTSREKWNHNLELFARFVMPQFQGSLRGVQRSYARMIDDNVNGRLPTASVGHLKTPGK